jgi:hypothetical protein
MVMNKLKLSREAILFDSPLYLLKAFLGVMMSYLLFSHHPVIGKDMISVLFGMMLSLEPVNVSGIKSGVAQFEATILGGLVTAVIITLAGVNFITVPLAVVVTLYISLLLDWKNISPVAFFTAIYMTQYIQYTQAGAPSMVLTFRLRIMALGTGVVVAIFLNFIFSILFYKSMVHKRTTFLFEKLIRQMDEMEDILSKGDHERILRLKSGISGLFGDIDFVYGHVQDMSQEKKKKKSLLMYLEVIASLRLFNHYLFDLALKVEETWSKDSNRRYSAEVKVIKSYLRALAQLDQRCLQELKAIEGPSPHFNKLMTCLERIKASIE